MRPEYYADEYRRYATFVKNYSGSSTQKFACGANVDDYDWTEVLMSRAGRQMQGLSLHYLHAANKQMATEGFIHAVWRRSVALDARPDARAWMS